MGAPLDQLAGVIGGGEAMLSRARQVLLESIGIQWIRATIEAIAGDLWIEPRASRGRADEIGMR